MNDVPESLATMVSMLRSSIMNARIDASRTLEGNVSFCISNIRDWTNRTPEIDAACFRAETACVNFAGYVVKRGLLYSASETEAQRLRDWAIHAIDELESALRNARASEEASILHLPW